MTPYIPIGGTRDWGGDSVRWWQAESAFTAWMAAHGYERRRPDTPFWSTATGGLIPGDGHRVWKHGAVMLSTYLLTLPEEDRRLIALSHGGQVATLAVALYGVKVHSLITICTPVRNDLDDVYQVAALSIDRWTHVYASSWWKDWTQLAGAVFDRGLRIARAMPVPNVENVGVPGIGHSDLVANHAHFAKWETHNLLERL